MVKKAFSRLIHFTNPWRIIYIISKIPYMGRIINWAFYKYFDDLRSIKLHITYACNYRCPYCYSGNFSKKSLNTDKWIKIINELKGFDVHTVEISGGEPFVDKDLFKIIDKCKDYRLTIYTNGSLVNKKIVDRLVKHPKQVTLSFKYDCEECYEENTKSGFSLKKIEENMAIASKKIPIIGFITVTKKNFPKLKKMINRIIDLGGFPVIERYMPVNGRNEEFEINVNMWKDSIKIIKKVYLRYKSLIEGIGVLQGSICSCYRTQLSVMQNGDVLPCQFLPLKESIGNVKKSSLRDIWKKARLKREKWLGYPKVCNSCRNVSICKGGCPTYKYYIKGEFKGKDILCIDDEPMSYGHSAFTVIHSMGKHFSNKRLVRLENGC